MLEEAIHTLFIEQGWTLSIAESCTGGAASSRLTQHPGASQYFLGSVVCYSNELKYHLLGVPEKLLQEKGAVSEEVVRHLAKSIINLTGSDFSLAVTGIAGPNGGTPEKPVGTIWGAVCRKGAEPYAWKLHAKGDRQMIIKQSVDSLFNHLLLQAREGL